MYPDIPVWLAVVFLTGGLYALAWSANRFVDGSAAVARALGVSPFVIGMVVIGFGTSAPELCVSVLSGLSRHSDVSLGNAYGSCIFNIAAILGVAALIRPLPVKPSVRRVAAPALVLISLFSCLLVGAGGGFSRMDGLWELGVFAVLLPLYCWYDQKVKGEGGRVKGEEGEMESSAAESSHPSPFITLITGLAALVASSHILVWGAVDLARAMGVSELLIGLTIVAAGTSLPELASAVASARKGEHEFVLGNIIGSNFFNTLAVVGLAGFISPFEKVSPYILSRDMPVMVALSLSLAVFGANWRHPRADGRIGRVKGGLWLLAFAAYLALTLVQET